METDGKVRMSEDQPVEITVTIKFKSDRMLTENEMDDLVSTLFVQVEEPQTSVTDPVQVDCWQAAEYTTGDIRVIVMSDDPNSSVFVY